MLRLVSYSFPLSMLYSWRTFRLLSPVLSGCISIMTRKACWCHLFHEVYCCCATCRSCMLCSLCHVVHQKRFLLFVICYGWLLFIISTLHWFCFWCLFCCFGCNKQWQLYKYDVYYSILHGRSQTVQYEEFSVVDLSPFIVATILPCTDPRQLSHIILNILSKSPGISALHKTFIWNALLNKKTANTLTVIELQYVKTTP